MSRELGDKLLEKMTEGMDTTFGATMFPWKLRISQDHYDVLKEWERDYKYEWMPRPLFIQRDEYEYIRLNIPFILDYRIVIDNGFTVGSPIVELDNLFDPDIAEKYLEAFRRSYELELLELLELFSIKREEVKKVNWIDDGF